MASDTVIIRDLLVRGIIGVNDWEREKKQDIVINLSLSVDARAAGESDDVADVLNYRTLTKRVIAHVEGAEPYLVEALAHQIARIAIVDFGAVRAKVRVEKPGALRYARSVGVEVERTAADYA
ncbi:dihydroneopterin aldolase [Candidatus Palauibacter polyketidifaciens]|uniref:dihydroneopterin aldolase n=1 Tax=Candidatus Palauibacter polyketidifaciens TaxID=3056740 RepID=UPI0023A0EE5D|nr:dihydroneopterin aldolase [Candidatus Palauibacter polyketidifaciens]MDE2720952.1 dihydroneopterin aldolase [Candidatus Palauibacter polyketidifaciens]